MTPGTFRGLDKLICTSIVTRLVFVPLGLWKLSEIILWIAGK